MKVTVFLGPRGNDFILNGKLKDLNAEVRSVTLTAENVALLTVLSGSLRAFDYTSVWARGRLRRG